MMPVRVWSPAPFSKQLKFIYFLVLKACEGLFHTASHGAFATGAAGFPVPTDLFILRGTPACLRRENTPLHRLARLAEEPTMHPQSKRTGQVRLRMLLNSGAPVSAKPGLLDLPS